MSGYADFSEFYDRLMSDVGYTARAAYYLDLFERFGGKHPSSLLDIACGSGNLTGALVAYGIEVVGVDVSAPMLAKAADKLAGCEPPVLLLQQDMRELDLYGTAEGAICSLDSINHLCATKDIRRFLERLRLFVEPGGLFVFDVNTPFKHREVLGDNAFVFEESDFLCIWRNRFIARTGETEMLLDFFVEQEDGSYQRFFDTVRERGYSIRTVKTLLSETGWDCLAVFDDGTYDLPTATCERWVFVARNNRTVEEALGMKTGETAYV